MISKIAISKTVKKFINKNLITDFFQRFYI